MIFNVAQLLKATVGTSIEENFEEEGVQLDHDLKVLGPITGHVRMRRTNQCILADGWVELTVELSCTRCLRDFEHFMHVPFEERYYPTVDILTGLAAPEADDEDDVFYIDDHHHLDLTEAIRQNVLLAIPMVTLCKEECAGLCSRCGHDLNLGPCDCPPEVDERFSVLSSLLGNELSEAQNTQANHKQL